jgi:hypothetical protein
LDMLVDRCGWCRLEKLRWWLGRFCEEEPGCCEPAADEPGGEESLRSAVLVTSLLEDTRPSMCFTFCDLLRLCVLWRGQSTGLQIFVPLHSSSGKDWGRQVEHLPVHGGGWAC